LRLKKGSSILRVKRKAEGKGKINSYLGGRKKNARGGGGEARAGKKKPSEEETHLFIFLEKERRGGENVEGEKKTPLCAKGREGPRPGKKGGEGKMRNEGDFFHFVRGGGGRLHSLMENCFWGGDKRRGKDTTLLGRR